jgi:hypothetical protein
MASLALLVSIIFLCVLLSGPLALLLRVLNFKILAIAVSIFAIFSGGYWLCLAPIPVSLLGLLGIFCGIKVILNR